MPHRPSSNYSLRARPHNKTLITKTTQLNDQDFVIRSIYKDCILNIYTIILTVLCMYITAPPVNYSILCIANIVHMVAFVNLLLKKMVGGGGGWIFACHITATVALQLTPVQSSNYYIVKESEEFEEYQLTITLKYHAVRIT